MKFNARYTQNKPGHKNLLAEVADALNPPKKVTRTTTTSNTKTAST